MTARLGIDSGVDVPTSSVAQSVKDAARKQAGTLLRGNVHGVDVFPDDANVTFPIIRGVGEVRSAPDPFLDDLAGLFTLAGNITQRTRDIALLLNYALTRTAGHGGRRLSALNDALRLPQSQALLFDRVPDGRRNSAARKIVRRFGALGRLAPP